MNCVLKNGTLLDPANGIYAKHDLFVSDGVIAAIDEEPQKFKTAEVIDCSGLTIIPGIVDLCARTREPGQEKKARIESETYAAVAGGVTTLCCPPDTQPVVDTPAMIYLIHERAEQMGHCHIEPLGALTRGLNSKAITDMGALRDAGCVGVSNAQNAITDSLVLRRALQYADTFDLTTFLRGIDPYLQGNGVVHEGVISTKLGLPSAPVAAETVGIARDIALIDATRAKAHFGQISSAQAVAMLATAKKDKLAISADVTIHHLHLTEEDVGMFDTRCHVQPPLRTKKDRNSLIKGVAKGVVDAICSDHQPHGMDAKNLPFAESEPGISGLETLLPLTLKLVEEGKLELETAVRALTINPARILKIDAQRGHLGIGALADICIFDANEHAVVNSTSLNSRGKNTPFDGYKLPGVVQYTLVAGRLKYRRKN